MTIRHLFLDQVVPLALSRQGRLVLHASAVATPGGAIAFLGASGQGKSTLTAYLWQRGLPLLADDCLLLEAGDGGFQAVPSYAGLRLWPDALAALFGHKSKLPRVAHYTGKKRLAPGHDLPRPPSAPVSLRRLYVLSALDEDVAIIPFAGPDAFLELLQHAFRLDVSGHARLQEEFERLARVAALPLFRRLSFPRDFAGLEAVREAILSDVSA